MVKFNDDEKLMFVILYISQATASAASAQHNQSRKNKRKTLKNIVFKYGP